MSRGTFHILSSRFASMAVLAAFTLGVLTAATVNALRATETDVIVRPVVQGTPTPTALTEDSPGWDGLRQGNHAARVDGLLLFNLDSLTGDPYTDCVALLDLWQLTGEDRAGFVSVELCEPVRDNR